MNPRANFGFRIAAVCCLCLAGSVAFAQSARVFFSTPLNLSHNLDDTGLSYSTHVVADSDGNVHVIWAEFDCQQVFPFTCTWHLFYTRSADGGATFSTPQDVANQSPGDALFGPQIAVDPWGKINIAWEGDATGANIFFARSTDSGATFSLPINLSLDNGAASDPSLAVDTHGNIDIVWQSQSVVDQSFNSFFSRSSDGVNFSAPASFCSPGNNCSVPQIALDARGNINLVFVSAPCVNCVGDVMFSHSANAGSKFSTPLDLSNSAAPMASNPLISLGPHGSANVVWSKGAAGSEQVFFARSNNGLAFSAPIVLSNGAGNSHFPELGLGPARYSVRRRFGSPYSEAVNAAWLDDATGDIFFSNSIDRGLAFSAPKPVSSAVGSFGTEPYMAVDSDGRVNLVWQDSATNNILFTRSNDGGAAFSTPRNISASPSFSTAPQIVADAIGNLNVSWFDETTPIEDVFFSRGTSFNLLRKQVRELPASVFKHGNQRFVTLTHIENARHALDHHDRALAAGKLIDLVQHMNGCGSSPDSNDWIVDCTAQLRIRNSLNIVIAGLSQ
jgi:hypothetical protein